MVWFQCEDCGDNLKKPKLPNHFRLCSASKLSCIDCGKVFGQQNVDSHTQCITEAEKYGPKGQGKASNGMNIKPKNDSKQKPEVDINVGLSKRPPWFCSLCNTKTTSEQTLLLHADGKKHRAKARAFHAANQQPNDTVETKHNAKNEIPENKDLGESRDQHTLEVERSDCSGVEKNALKSNKKRKFEAFENDGAQQKTAEDISAKLGTSEIIAINGAESEATKCLKRTKNCVEKEDAKSDSTTKENGKKKIKWKKLITSALKSNPDGILKFKKLKRVVLKSLEESAFAEDKNQASQIIEQKINSSSRFRVHGNHVRLAINS